MSLQTFLSEKYAQILLTTYFTLNMHCKSEKSHRTFVSLNLSFFVFYSAVMVATTYSDCVPILNLPPHIPMPVET